MTCFTLLLCCVLPATIDSWPTFLGAGASQASAAPLPLEWTPTKNIAWRADLPGHGQSSPVIWGEHVFVTSVEGPKKDTYHTACIDLVTGKERWRKTIANSSPIANSYYVSRGADAVGR